MESEVFDQIVNDTDLLQIIKWVFEITDIDREIKEMKSLACLLCVNLAMGNEASINAIIDPKYGVLDHMKRALELNDISNEHLSNIVWFIANVAVENIIIC